MTLSCCRYETDCVKWTAQLPHPDGSCRSPNFSLDGPEWYFELKGVLKQISSKPDRYVEGWTITLQPCSKRLTPSQERHVVLYVAKALAYERVVGSYSLEFDRRILASNDATITMLFWFAPKTVSASKEIARRPDSVSAQTLSFESLSKDMAQLLDNKETSDVVLKCGDSIFPAHRSILSVRSDVFAAMFRQNMTESRSGVVDIVDLSSSVLEQFVRYLYSGKVEEMTMERAVELYQVGEKYAIQSLKSFCASFMRENLSREVVCKILLLAAQVGDSELQEAAECFVAESKDFLKTEEWREFAVKHPEICTNVFLKYTNKL